MLIPQLVAHRGYTRHYPENTLISIEAAVTAGARFVEVDVQITLDQVPVLFHDRNLRRLCGVCGKIHERRFEELEALRVADPERFGERFKETRITRLDELGHFLTQHPDVTAFIELKRSSLEHFGIETMLHLVRHALKPVLKQCVLISYALDALLVARQNGWPRIGVVVDHWRERQQEIIAAIQPQFLFCDVNGLPPKGELRLPGVQLVIFEVADPLVALMLAARGVDFIETYAVGEMLRALASSADAG